MPRHQDRIDNLVFIPLDRRENATHSSFSSQPGRDMPPCLAPCPTFPSRFPPAFPHSSRNRVANVAFQRNLAEIKAFRRNAMFQGMLHCVANRFHDVAFPVHGVARKQLNNRQGDFSHTLTTDPLKFNSDCRNWRPAPSKQLGGTSAGQSDRHRSADQGAGRRIGWVNRRNGYNLGINRPKNTRSCLSRFG
jgi:hypothetical protein